MIYQIKNNHIVPLMNRNGKRYKFESKHDKKIHTAKAKSYRDPKFFKFYESTKWRKLSRYVREHEALCRACVKEYESGNRRLEKVNLSSSVDHIVPLNVNWSKRLDINNLQPLCHYHHVKKSNSDRQINDYK